MLKGLSSAKKKLHEVVLNLQPQMGPKFPLLNKAVIKSVTSDFAIVAKQITAVVKRIAWPLNESIFPTHFACRKAAGKVTNGYHMIPGCCNWYMSVAKHPNFNNVTMGMLQWLFK